jgi:hypothetical protein
MRVDPRLDLLDDAVKGAAEKTSADVRNAQLALAARSARVDALRQSASAYMLQTNHAMQVADEIFDLVALKQIEHGHPHHVDTVRAQKSTFMSHINRMHGAAAQWRLLRGDPTLHTSMNEGRELLAEYRRTMIRYAEKRQESNVSAEIRQVEDEAANFRQTRDVHRTRAQTMLTDLANYLHGLMPDEDGER